ncbi:MAG: tetratricopeptide repeat protein [Bacteroidia bacterium]
MTHSQIFPPSDDRLSDLATRYLSLLNQAKNQGLPPSALTPIGEALRAWLENQPESAACLAAAAQNSEHRTLLLRSDNPEWLNLPWRLGVAEFPHLFLVKGNATAETLPDYFPSIALPLKILVMIASPEDSEWDRRLNYEQEEDQIINAFAPLLETGQVKIEFTEDGSLDALREKLRENAWHILHFSGHGAFHKGIGWLELETPGTMERVAVKAADFAAVLNAKPEHKPPLLVLSSCQTAQGGADATQTGVATALLQAGVPAVIAMSESIRDDYATAFAARLYQELGTKEPLHRAFRTAAESVREREFEETKGIRAPYHWLMPQLLMSKKVTQLADWSAAAQEIRYAGVKFTTGEAQILLTHEKGYQFVGRRKERARLLKALRQKQPVLIRGMGGVGKTALSEHLVQRLLAAEPQVEPFFFNETSLSLPALVEALKAYFLRKKKFTVQTRLKDIEKVVDQVWVLLEELENLRIKPVFIFDNLEDFQQGPGQPFKPEYEELEEVIQTLAQAEYYLIFTSRYPLSGLDHLHDESLNQAGKNDFWKKSLQTQLYQRYMQLSVEQLQDFSGKNKVKTAYISYRGFIEDLYTLMGGNYRLLEYFDGILAERPEKLPEALKGLAGLGGEIVAAQEKMASGERGNRLILGELLDLLTEGERTVLHLLAPYRIPVTEMAVRLQKPDQSWEPVLQTLSRMTLAERHEDPAGRVYWYVVPLLKDHLRENGQTAYPFSDEAAGRYYRYAAENHTQSRLEHQEEAFYHYCLAGNIEEVARLGDVLSRVYRDASLYRQALVYAETAAQMAGDIISTGLRNRLGELFYYTGDYDNALKYWEEILEYCRGISDMKSEGQLLNSISQIYFARSDYEKALSYLNLSLMLSLETGDKLNESMVLGNISQIYDARGDYEKALSYLEQSLEINREIGSISGEAKTLGNIGNTYYARGDYKTSLFFLDHCLKISRKIGHKLLEGRSLGNIGKIHDALGNYITAIEYFEQSRQILEKIGDKSGLGKVLGNIGGIYYDQNDYKMALLYMEKSIAIMQEIGDKLNEGTCLNNIGNIYLNQGNYEIADQYLEQGLNLSLEIGDKSGESISLMNLATIKHKMGDYKKALVFFMQSLNISKEIGDKHSEGTVLNSISQIYFDQGDYEIAIKYLQESLQIRREIGDKLGEGLTLGNLGRLFFVLNEDEVGLQYMNESLLIHKKIGAKHGQGAAFDLIAQVYSKRKDFKTALQYLEKSLQINREIGDLTGEATTLNNIGEILYTLIDYKKASQYFDQALRINRQTGYKLGLSATLNNMAVIILEYQKKPEEALKLFLEAHSTMQKIGSPNIKAPEKYLNQIRTQIGEARFQELIGKMGG